MRILKTGIISVLFAAFILTTASYAADVKIGVFNFDKIMTDSKMGKEAKTKLENRHQSLKAVLEKKKVELETMDAKLEKDGAVMGKDKYTEKKYEIQKKAIDFKELERKSTDEMMQLRQELVAGINKEVVAILSQIGKKENYTVIFEKNISGTAYFNEQIDLTSRIVKALNSK